MSVVVFLLALGLAARLTRLFVQDSITAELRVRFRDAAYAGRTFELNSSKDGGEYSKASLKNRLAKFFSDMTDCDWCTSVWASALAFGWAATATHVGGSCLISFTWVSAAASASYLVGVVATALYAIDGD